MDFCWVDQYDVMAGPNRKSRRLMEEENKKLRKKAKREYNEAVRGLGEFVKKRDKRVIDMQMKRNEELERKREEERERKRKMEIERAERAGAYEEPEWSKVEEIGDAEVDEVEENETRKGDGEELYCVACGKKFKSEKQWMNHEQSKKHQEKVTELREALLEEERENEESEEEDGEEGELLGDHVDGSGFTSADDAADKLWERFQSGFSIQEEGDDHEVESSKEEYFVDIDKGDNLKGSDEELGLDDDEASILEAMISGHKSRKNVSSMHMSRVSTKKVNVEVDSDDMDFMEYNNMKGTRKKKGGRRERGKKNNEEAVGVVAKTNSQDGTNNGFDDE